MRWEVFLVLTVKAVSKPDVNYLDSLWNLIKAYIRKQYCTENAKQSIKTDYASLSETSCIWTYCHFLKVLVCKKKIFSSTYLDEAYFDMKKVPYDVIQK